MMTILRKHRQWLMIVIAILALPFVFYFVQKPDYGSMQSDQFARIYGRNISKTQAQREARLLALANELGMTDFVQDLTGGTASDPNQTAVAFIINVLIVRHEADQLGIRPTRDEIVDRIRNLPAFRGPNGFDPKKYEEFAGNALGPNGLAEAEIEEVVQDELSLRRVKQLLDASVTLSDKERDTEFDRAYGKLIASAIRLHNADFTKDMQVSDDDAKKYFEAHQVEFKSEEKRKIEFVRFTLTDAQKKLTGKERVDVLTKLQDRANDFSQALLEKTADFHQVAAKFQLPVEATGEFAMAAPDPKLREAPKLSGLAFQLTKEEPNSDVVEEETGYYVLHLVGIVDARALTLEEAKPKIVDAIKTQRAREQVSTRGAKIVHDLREALKAGTPLPKAVAQLGVKPEKLEPFTLSDQPQMDEKKPLSMDTFVIKNAAAQLQPGEVSEFAPSPDGGVVTILEKREPPDPAKAQATKTSFGEDILRSKRMIVFYAWLQDRQKVAMEKS
jgi:peptidyl-prolyl cis-trans isomerase D